MRFRCRSSSQLLQVLLALSLVCLMLFSDAFDSHRTHPNPRRVHVAFSVRTGTRQRKIPFDVIYNQHQPFGNRKVYSLNMVSNQKKDRQHDQRSVTKHTLFSKPSHIHRGATITTTTSTTSLTASATPDSSWIALENDFSSAESWENYYRLNPFEGSRLEWHSSISMDLLCDYCLNRYPNHNDDDKNTIINEIPTTTNSNNKNVTCIMIGCGTSQLPGALLSKSNTVHIILLDSSRSCIETLQERYGFNHQQITYLCGSALELTNLIRENSPTKVPMLLSNDIVILDKGLMDAIFCSDQWNEPIQSLLMEANRTIHESMNPTNGKYVLVSYKLSNSTKSFLNEIGNEVGCTWQYNCTGSNQRVSISVGTFGES